MAKSKSSKRVKASNGGIDRISNLPDSLLSHILSLLPTDCAVATSILSTRWMLLWVSITNLDFCSPRHYGGTQSIETKNQLKMKSSRFTLFVNRVLLLLNPPSIQNFRLKCYRCCFDSSYLNSWISVGFGRTVREFDLSLVLKEEERVELPLSHIYCNVAVLKLAGHIRFNIHAGASICFPSLQALHLNRLTCVIAGNSSVSFPNLKIMHLKYVKFEDEDSVHKLFSSSPILDDLLIEGDDFDAVQCLIICVPSLTRLSIHTFSHLRMNKLQLNCPALEYLNLVGRFPCEDLVAENLSSLLQANVNMFRDYDVNEEICINIIKFIGNISFVKFLSVSGFVMQAFRTVSANISLDFHNLTRLEIKVCECLDFSVMINNFLENMDKLEHLVVEGQGWGYTCSHQTWWTEPLNVPKCLLSRVTTVSFRDIFDDCSDHLKMLRYFLKNAEVLQLLTVCLAHTSEKKQLEMVKKIALIPRGSRSCEVAFT